MTDHLPTAAEPVPQPRQTTAYLKNLFRQVGFTIDARRGQNFLVDLNLVDLLVKTADIAADDVVLEVGTGTGVVTERTSGLAAHVVAAEIDARLAQLARERLVDRRNVTLVEGDALAGKHRFAPALLAAVDAALAASPRGRLLLVANLPYCIATPVISNLLALPRPFATAVVTVQREMAERMTARSGTGDYNALSVWVGAQCRGEIVRVLPPSVFWPRPKVESAIVRLELEPERRAAIGDLARFHEFVREVFCHRRKVLRGVLLRLAGGKQVDAARATVERTYAALGLPADIRAEDIPPDEFVRLVKTFHGES
ncbi:MAG: 16S rRNA (adenine(1518)-N(6)/adenine(1519)-N(6))-dimethyltransferase RsmA [Planctomycetaceae bacterium]